MTTNSPIPSTIKVYEPTEALPFCIIAELKSHHCDFRCYECAALSVDKDGEYTTPKYHIENYNSSLDLTQNLAEAQIYLSGSIKWDGCANLHFDEQESVALHFCGRKDAARVGLLIDRLYDIAAELIPSWDEELGA